MKTVFSSNSEVAHVWAQRTHSYGRNQNGSLFFNGGNLYSYGYHCLLGEFITNEKNEVAVIINTDYYSATTAKHSNLAWGATTHYTQFERKYTEERRVISLLNDLEAKLLRARKPLIYISEANAIIDAYSDYLKFKHGRAVLPKSIIKAYAPFKLDDDELKVLQDKDRKRRNKEAQKEKEKLKIEINAFLNYKTDYINNYKINDAYIRISKDKKCIETSKGVKVPVREARALYNKILKGEDIKGFKIGYYTVISLKSKLKIGCHNINLKNMHEVGKQLLSMDIAPEKTV
jgi:hypothetical protein